MTVLTQSTATACVRALLPTSAQLSAFCQTHFYLESKKRQEELESFSHQLQRALAHFLSAVAFSVRHTKLCSGHKTAAAAAEEEEVLLK